MDFIENNNPLKGETIGSGKPKVKMCKKNKLWQLMKSPWNYVIGKDSILTVCFVLYFGVDSLGKVVNITELG